jgi:hypothetical protein
MSVMEVLSPAPSQGGGGGVGPRRGVIDQFFFFFGNDGLPFCVKGIWTFARKLHLHTQLLIRAGLLKVAP